METARWRFVSNGNAGYTGVNDSGIETFSSNTVCSLVREVIQNALDAQQDDTKPVKVEFSQFEINYQDFPGYEGFSESVHACLRDNDDEDAQSFFSHAADVIDGKYNGKIRVLRISDFNTIGLTGAETGEKGTNWSRLVKERGASNKNETSQGSFGIGKSAPFACSDLRTVFYSSMCGSGKNCVKSNIGVAWLISFKRKNVENGIDDWTTGTGFYSDSDKLLAIPHTANIDSSFTRKESGTDIYVMGFEVVQDFEEKIIENVLLNFLVSIWSNMLVVNVNGRTIDKESLQRYIFNINSDGNDDLKNLKAYYNLLTKDEPAVVIIPLDSNKYGKQFGFEDGECELRLAENQGLNRRILMTRKSGMKLFEQDHINGTIDFTGILRITGSNMNKDFRKMEVTSHDKWVPDRIKKPADKKRAEEEYQELKKYLRKCVKDSFGHTQDELLDVFGMADYLPDLGDNDTMADSNAHELLNGDIAGIHEKTMSIPPKKKVKDPKEDIPDLDDDNQRNEKEKKHYKKVPVEIRVRVMQPKAGQYRIQFITPRDSNQAKIQLFIVTERGVPNPSVDVTDAVVVDGSAMIEKCAKNVIFLKQLHRSEKIELHCNLNLDRYCKMEAEYYEDQK